MQIGERQPLQMKVKRRVSAPPPLRETEKPIAEPRPEVETGSAHVTTPSVSPATKPLTNAVRPRAQSLSDEHLPQSATTRTQRTTVPVVRSIPAPEQESSARTSEAAAVVSTAKAASQPRPAERQAAVQRLVVGTALDARMTAVGIHVNDLDQKIGLQQMLSTKLKTPGEEAKVAAFLKEMTSTPDAEKLPASSLNLLYARTDELTGREGLKEFAVRSLINAENEQDVSKFLDDLSGTDAVQLSADRLAQIYAVRADVMSKPGLKGFLIKAHIDKQNINDLNEFVAAYKGSAAADLDASKLRFLFDQRADLKENAGLNDFVVEALSKGESTESLKPFLAESKDPRVATFKKEQVSLFYRNYARVKDESELKEVVIDKLATTVDWEAGLNRFLEAIGPLNTKPLKSQQLDFIYGLDDDLKATVLDRPNQGQKTNLAVLAVDQFSDQTTASGAIGEISDLRAFGYKGGFLDAARAGAKKLGEKKYSQALQNLNADEKKAIAAVPKQFVAPVAPAKARPSSSLSKKDQRSQKGLIEEWNQYDADKRKFDTELPQEISTETNRLKASYKQQRDDLANGKDANFVTPEFEKNRQFASSAGFSDDAQWALKLAGDSEQAQILFLACQDTPELKKFGEWAVTSFAGQELEDVLSAAKDLGGDSEKALAAAPFYASCPDDATRQWLKKRAATDTAADLKFEVGILTGHTIGTLKNATAAMDAAPSAVNDKAQYNKLLQKYNKVLKTAGLSDSLLALFKQVDIQQADLPAHDPPLVLNTIKNGGIKSATVQRIFDTYGDRGDLEDFLKAANPLPKDYGSLEEICALVRREPTIAEKDHYSIEDVTWALNLATTPQEARPMAVGKDFVKHLLSRVDVENRTRSDMTTNDMGHKEWLLVSGKPWGTVTVSNAGFGPTAMTGIFKLTIDGTDVQIHNHFKKKGGAQYSLHLKDGKGGLQGPELTAKQDKSVYGPISVGALGAYTTWVGNKGWDLYTV
jgi:hypothetical protein